MEKKEVLLVDAELEMNSMIETKETLWTTLTWTIMNFTKLKQDVTHKHYKRFLQYSWVLKLVIYKSDATLFFIVQTDNDNPYLKFAIIGKHNQVLNGKEYFRDSDGEIILKFSMEVILDPKNGYLKDDCLVLQFKYAEMESSDDKIGVIPWDEYRERTDLADFQTDWGEMYLQSRFWDFKIIAQGHVFYTHKVILIARSHKFATYFAEEGLDTQNEFILSASPYVVHEVLMFMYTGELVSMNVSSLLDVFELAHHLKIKSLMYKCLCILREEMNNDNVVVICLRALSIQHEYLINTCEQFMEINCPENIAIMKGLQ